MANKINKIEKLLQFCIDNFEDCGEFNFHGNKIMVFRRCEYENEEGQYVEGDESVIGIVNNEYSTGWYYSDEDDLKYVMEDAIKWIFSKKNIKLDFEIVGNVKPEALNKRVGIKSQIVEALKKEFKTFELLDVKVDERWEKQCKFKVKIQEGWNFYKGLINNHTTYYFFNDPLEDGKFELANDEDKKMFKEMFSYKISLF